MQLEPSNSRRNSSQPQKRENSNAIYEICQEIICFIVKS